MMQLEIGSFPVQSMEFRDSTEWRDGRLLVNRKELIETVTADPGIEKAEIEIVSPGEQARLVHLLDAVEPRVKVGGKAVAFPGFLGGIDTVGSGRTHRFDGFSLLTSCEVPWRSLGGLLMVREGIVDMSGPYAPYSPFSETINLVLQLELASSLEDEQCDRVTREAALRASAYLASCLAGMEPPQLETRELTKVEGGLPRVVYICQIQSQGLWARTFLYGQSLDHLLPTPIHPNEMLDGALVSGNQVYQCFKIPTWLHCNNPVVRDLYDRHGKDLDFRGVILSRGHFYTNEEKQLSANLAARLSEMMGADGVVITWEGGGNSAIDAMKTLQACEKRGIASVALSYELAGAGGDQDPLLFAVPEANALVSTGSTDEPVTLPPVARVVGGDTIRIKPEVGGVRLPAGGTLELEMGHELYCGANQLGYGLNRCLEF